MLREAKGRCRVAQDSHSRLAGPRSRVSLATSGSMWGTQEDAPVPGLADNTQFLALGLPLFFFPFLPSSQVCSILSQGVAANSIASRFAAEGWEELRASLGLRAFVLGQ